MGASYHQFCPVAKAMELLDERWTMLIVREMLLGSRSFNDLRRGVPRMSPTLLSKRMRQLVRAGLAVKEADGGYALTPAGRELQPVVESVAVWGGRWIGRIGDADLDPRLLMWDLHRRVDHAVVPGGRTVVLFRFPDASPRERDWWLVIADGDADVCDTDPGHDVAVTLTAPLRRMVDLWRGALTWPTALRSESVTLQGPEPLRRALPTWFLLPAYSSTAP
ncbi:winged helix-turn-helix transcriptional regulator [Actinocorallia herbida]|nr:helix-turn-helix domain-containing protein [Actinocorallia herbida]